MRYFFKLKIINDFFRFGLYLIPHLSLVHRAAVTLRTSPLVLILTYSVGKKMTYNSKPLYNRGVVKYLNDNDQYVKEM